MRIWEWIPKMVNWITRKADYGGAKRSFRSLELSKEELSTKEGLRWYIRFGDLGKRLPVESMVIRQIEELASSLHEDFKDFDPPYVYKDDHR